MTKPIFKMPVLPNAEAEAEAAERLAAQGLTPEDAASELELARELAESATLDPEFAGDMQQSFEEARVETAPAPKPVKLNYFVSVVAPIKDVNIYQDGVVTMPHEVRTHEDVNLLRKAMAQYLGVMPDRVTIQQFQIIDIEYA